MIQFLKSPVNPHLKLLSPTSPTACCARFSVQDENHKRLRKNDIPKETSRPHPKKISLKLLAWRTSRLASDLFQQTPATPLCNLYDLICLNDKVQMLENFDGHRVLMNWTLKLLLPYRRSTRKKNIVNKAIADGFFFTIQKSMRQSFLMIETKDR